MRCKCLGKIFGCAAPIYEAAARRVLFEAGVQTAAINVTPGGCCHWHIVASIKKAPGDGKNAILALLSIADIKHVTIVDDDIDVFDPVDVEWAVATRVQADRDVVIVSNAAPSRSTRLCLCRCTAKCRRQPRWASTRRFQRIFRRSVTNGSSISIRARSI